jgi:hypothetical protein
MTEPPLSQELTDFIRSSVPAYPAADVLVRVSREPLRVWTPQAVVESVPPLNLTPEAAREYLTHFVSAGLIRSEADGTFVFSPSSDALVRAVALLRDAYDHRPVTLIRIVASIATAKIQSFADSFKLKRD